MPVHDPTFVPARDYTVKLHGASVASLMARDMDSARQLATLTFGRRNGLTVHFGLDTNVVLKAGRAPIHGGDIVVIVDPKTV